MKLNLSIIVLIAIFSAFVATSATEGRVLRSAYQQAMAQCRRKCQYSKPPLRALFLNRQCYRRCVQ